MFFIGYSRDINNIIYFMLFNYVSCYSKWFFFFACIEGVKDKIIKYHLNNCYYENVQYAFEKVFFITLMIIDGTHGFSIR